MYFVKRTSNSALNRRYAFAIWLWTLLALISTPAALAQTPQIAAESYILLDAETGTVLAENNADMRLPPASLTKIMSTYLYFRAVRDGLLPLTASVEISRNAWASRVVGSKMFIEVNTQVSVEDLLRGVIVQSGNDAAIALAEAVSGDEQLFAREMNRTAAELGLTNSRFQNSTGLPADEHYTSARDIAEISRRSAQDFPELYALYKEREFTYNEIRQENRNGLLGTFTGADGVKTGYTRAAGYCLAASAVREDRRLVAVVMKTASPRAREQETKKLLTYGFNNFRNVRFFAVTDERTLPVWGGAAETVRVQPAQDGLYTVPRGARLELNYAPQTPVRAPVEKGQVLGMLQVLHNGAPHAQVEVVAAEAVPAGGWWKTLQDDIKLDWLGHGGGNAVLSEW